MRVLIVDEKGLAVQLSCSAQKAGHEVKHFILKTPKTEHIGVGICNLVDRWEDHTDWADFIILTDNTKYVQRCDQLRADGKLVLGATLESAALELDRHAGQALFKKRGIKTIPYKSFGDYDAAIRYVKKENRRFVSKPDDDGDNKALSYVSSHAADMVYMLERWKASDKLRGRFMLQDHVPGTEMAVGGWLGPSGFLGPWCENWEHKKLMSGDKGPNTGEMGTVIRYTSTSKLANRVLKPLEADLIKTGHIGYIDVNCIIDDSGYPWPLEFTSRFGWPTFNIQSVVHSQDPIAFLHSIATGKKPSFGAVGIVACGGVLAIPDFPYSHITRKEVIGVPIYGLTQALMEYVSLCEVKHEKRLPLMSANGVTYGPSYATAGDYIMVVTGLGLTIAAARERMTRRLERIKIPNSPFWRDDIGQKLRKDLAAIQPHGYATGLIYRSKD